MKTFLFNIYLIFYDIYLYLWYILFKVLGSIIFIYHINEDEIRNITWNYYLKYGLDRFRKGTFYTKIYSQYGIHHVAFDGELAHIGKIKIGPIENRPKRKNVILLDNGNPINIDLGILDNYKINMKHFDKSVKNLGLILKLIGLKCSHVTIIQLIPYNKTTMEIHNVDIDHLYH